MDIGFFVIGHTLTKLVHLTMEQFSLLPVKADKPDA